MKKPMLILLILLLMAALTLGVIDRFQPEAAPASAGMRETGNATPTDLRETAEASMTSLPGDDPLNGLPEDEEPYPIYHTVRRKTR